LPEFSQRAFGLELFRRGLPKNRAPSGQVRYFKANRRTVASRHPPITRPRKQRSKGSGTRSRTK
jgi:hypothetical protein